MKHTPILSALVLTLGQFFAPGAAQATVTFDDVVAGTTATSASITSDGFTFTTAQYHIVYAAPSLHASQFLGFWSGLNTPAAETFAATSGAPFNLSAVDMGGWVSFGDLSRNVTVTGLLAGGGQVSQTLLVAPTQFQTYTLNGFNQLSAVQFSLANSSNGYNTSYLAIDNLVATPVPEPENAVLLMAGLAVLLPLVRSRRQIVSKNQRH